MYESQMLLTVAGSELVTLCLESVFYGMISTMLLGPVLIPHYFQFVPIFRHLFTDVPGISRGNIQKAKAKSHGCQPLPASGYSDFGHICFGNNGLC